MLDYETGADRYEPKEGIHIGMAEDAIAQVLLVGLHDKLDVDIPESDYGKLRLLAELEKYLASRARL
ncbi:MAG TPA: hypothetical protein VNF68_00110 [Candidatus Baltobacteraceae bacterium]|nr:hypothetical protein [Candidatus Baltobacteraceae bacterium]